ncbi:hypothetical protein F2Q70_00024219 [Brassica cretica]|uniref:Uncharacterized protein n=1 Tax=Brassica cretica TaxID=69181 RepID=A0A8S9L9V5_BRACR|nr:hypothetical protein F2Q70_00024219 [Brassica cretica]
MKPPKRVVLKTLEVDAGSWKESPINLQRSVMVAISWTRGQRISVRRPTGLRQRGRNVKAATLHRLRRVSDLRSDPDPSADGDYGSGERTPLNLEAPHKERRTKGEQLVLETRTTSNSPTTVTGDRESPTTVREQDTRRHEVKGAEFGMLSVMVLPCLSESPRR